MRINNIKNTPDFQARIIIEKMNPVKIIGEQNIGLSTIGTGTASSVSASGFGIDAVAHQQSISVPDSIFTKGLFNTLRELGHNILNTFMKNNAHNSYDDIFFSGASSASTPYTSKIGHYNLKKGFIEYTRKFPS